MLGVPSHSIRLCIFCDQPVTKQSGSREDTVPKWLQKLLGIAAATVSPTLTSSAGEQLAQRIHPVDQLLTGGVCRDCNNGWMSQLESATQPILSALVRSERDLKTLNRAERQTLSRWTVKTALMLDVGGLEPRVPLFHFKELFANRPHIPEGLYVFARHHAATLPWYYIGGAWWKYPTLEANALQTAQDTSYKIALQFREIILIVAYWPLRNWGLRVERGELSLLWPTTAVVKEYVHPEPQDVSASDDACRRYMITIGVVPHRRAEGFIPSRRGLTSR